jgi:hypothetical protein
MFAAIVIDAACGLGIVATTVFVVHMSVRANTALKALQNCQHNPSPSNKNNLNYFAELANYALIPGKLYFSIHQSPSSIFLLSSFWLGL